MKYASDLCNKICLVQNLFFDEQSRNSYMDDFAFKFNQRIHQGCTRAFGRMSLGIRFKSSGNGVFSNVLFSCFFTRLLFANGFSDFISTREPRRIYQLAGRLGSNIRQLDIYLWLGRGWGNSG